MIVKFREIYLKQNFIAEISHNFLFLRSKKSLKVKCEIIRFNISTLAKNIYDQLTIK